MSCLAVSQRKHAIGYCDPREDLRRFTRLSDSKLHGYVAVAFSDDIGIFWFHMLYVSCCLIDADTHEEAEFLYNKCRVFRDSSMRYGTELSAHDIVEGGWEWKPGIDFRDEPLCLDRAVKLESGAWVNEVV